MHIKETKNTKKKTGKKKRKNENKQKCNHGTCALQATPEPKIAPTLEGICDLVHHMAHLDMPYRTIGSCARVCVCVRVSVCASCVRACVRACVRVDGVP